MTTTADPKSASDRALVLSFFQKLGTENDIDGWLKLIAKDVVVETPFAPVGQRTHFRGRREIELRFGNARRPMKSMEFFDIEILSTEDPERWVALCKGRGVHAEGAQYANSYCWLFRVRGGEIVWWREYYDPQPVMPFLDKISMNTA